MAEWTEIINQVYWFFLLFSFLFGASIGSFLNVVIYRLPTEDKSIVKPRSFCPSCKTPIAAYDNIPLISYLLLGGKCRHCSAKINSRYFLVELMTGAFAVAFFHLAFKVGRFHPLAALVYFVFTCAMIVITFIDIDLKIIPNVISLPGIPLGLACSFFMPHSFLSSLFGILIGAGTLLAIALGYYFITKREGMGLGDVKLMGMIGAFLGWKAVPFTMLAGSMVGLLYGILPVVFAKKGRFHQIPFGPFLAFGAVVYIFYGPEIMDWYLSLMGR